MRNEKGDLRVTRREFAVASGGTLFGAAVFFCLPIGCSMKRKEKGVGKAGNASAKVGSRRGEVMGMPGIESFSHATEKSFPLLEIKGKPYEIGYAIGKRFAGDIRRGFELRAKWWKELKDFAEAQPPALYEAFYNAARKHAPGVLEELKGWAEGSGIPLRDLMLLNLTAEYGALKEEADGSKVQEPSAGCSTIVIRDGSRLIIAHNEDGDGAYLEHMFMLKVHPEGKPSFLCACYPGILPGNAPWVNDEGIVMTTNFIYSRRVRTGVGRYFLHRLAMEARTVEEALEVCIHPERAYAFHHIIASRKTGRAVSLEVTTESHRKVDIVGTYLHTNHLLDRSLAAEARDLEFAGPSTIKRWEVLSRWREAHIDASATTEADLLEALTSHEERPYSPCRHPEGEVRGATLLAAIVDIGVGRMRIYKKQPCLGLFEDYPFPGDTPHPPV